MLKILIAVLQVWIRGLYNSQIGSRLQKAVFFYKSYNEDVYLYNQDVDTKYLKFLSTENFLATESMKNKCNWFC